MTIPVIFRAERSGQFKGEVTAVFPSLPGTNAYDMTCYAHVGQHSSCSMEWYGATRSALSSEYAELMAELQRIYEGELVVAKRITPQHRQARKQAA